MRSFVYLFTAALQVAPAFALPIPRHRMALQDTLNAGRVEVLEYDGERAYSKFEVYTDLMHEKLTTPLVLELHVNPTKDLLISNVSLNNQHLDFGSSTDSEASSQSLALPTSQTFIVPDRLGVEHSLAVLVSERIPLASDSPVATIRNDVHEISFRIDMIDGFASNLAFVVKTNPLAPLRLLSLRSVYASQTVDFESIEQDRSSMTVQPLHDDVDNQLPAYSADAPDHYALDIHSEIESLLRLETEASQLHEAIAAKKEAIAKHLKQHRDQVTLQHLLRHCDGLVCAVKVITQRICDKVGILTMPGLAYANVQDAHLRLSLENIALNNETSHVVSDSKFPSEKSVNGTLDDRTQSSAASVRPVHIDYPQNVLLRVLAIIVTALGLATLLSLLRKKCMSMRRRVERAADAEERRNARAYRRAARRAAIRRRWDAFVAAVSCFRAEAEPRVEDYEEKRALILQDAFLEQDIDAAEKEEVMEAEIRQLRHAHEIVCSLVHADENRRPAPVTIGNTRPPLASVPHVLATRSRAASIATLGNPPSYFSESLPDYSSRYQQTEVCSSGVSLRSVSIVTSDDNLHSSTASRRGSCNGSTISRSLSPVGSTGTRTSRFTAISSIIETSPRASNDTFRTGNPSSCSSEGGNLDQ